MATYPRIQLRNGNILSEKPDHLKVLRCVCCETLYLLPFSLYLKF